MQAQGSGVNPGRQGQGTSWSDEASARNANRASRSVHTLAAPQDSSAGAAACESTTLQQRQGWGLR